MASDYNKLCNSATPPQDFHSSSFARDVNYSCGSCGYELNLNSCNRNTSIIGAKYEKSIKKGTFSFYSIDESRFTQIEELRCLPYYTSIRSWGLFEKRTKLFCYKCGNHIGIAHKHSVSSASGSSPGKFGKLDSDSWDGICDDGRVYEIRIRALQPSSADQDFTLSLCDA